jgi:hypothetical protein
LPMTGIDASSKVKVKQAMLDVGLINA